MMDLTRLTRGIYGRLYGRARLSFPSEPIVPLEDASHVLLRLSGSLRRFQPEPWSQEVAFANAMAARGRSFGVTCDASEIFGKSVMWFHRADFVVPRLWNYAKQAQLFVAGIEEQGNRAFASSAELRFWENKAFMHRRLDEIAAPTPRTRILTAASWAAAEFDLEPVLLKQEHSSGSEGVRHFPHAADARRFVERYAFRPTESLIMQEVVRGATRDLRVTMVGDRLIESASYWRIKSPEMIARSEWTTTATSNSSTVVHGNVPDSAVEAATSVLQTLGLRTAGFDFIWVDDDTTGPPLLLELSPVYQPNPPKPRRYAHWSYKRYKRTPYVPEGYFARQHSVFREIAGQVLDQGMY